METIGILASKKGWPLPNEISRMIGKHLENLFIIQVAQWREEHINNSGLTIKELFFVQCQLRKGYSLKRALNKGYCKLCKDEMLSSWYAYDDSGYHMWVDMFNTAFYHPDGDGAIGAKFDFDQRLLINL